MLCCRATDFVCSICLWENGKAESFCFCFRYFMMRKWPPKKQSSVRNWPGRINLSGIRVIDAASPLRFAFPQKIAPQNKKLRMTLSWSRFLQRSALYTFLCTQSLKPPVLIWGKRKAIQQAKRNGKRKTNDTVNAGRTHHLHVRGEEGIVSFPL